MEKDLIEEDFHAILTSDQIYQVIMFIKKLLGPELNERSVISTCKKDVKNAIKSNHKLISDPFFFIVSIRREKSKKFRDNSTTTQENLMKKLKIRTIKYMRKQMDNFVNSCENCQNEPKCKKFSSLKFKSKRKDLIVNKENENDLLRYSVEDVLKAFFQSYSGTTIDELQGCQSCFGKIKECLSKKYEQIIREYRESNFFFR